MDNINDIISSLTPDDIKALKETADSIFGSGNKNDFKPPEPKFNTSVPGFDLSGINPEMFMKLGSMISAMNSDGGKRCKLIEALKPNLSPQRQHKADEAIQILKLMEVLPMIKELTNRDD